MTTRIFITPAQLSQVDELQAVIQRAYRGHSAAAGWSHEGDVIAGERVSPAALADLINDPRSRLSVAISAGQIVGSSLVTNEAAGRCEIRMLSVEPALQGNGIGDRLLSAAEMEGAQDFAVTGIAIEVLEHRRKLIAYYQRRGYRPTGATRPYPHPVKTPTRFLVLKKELLQP